MPRNPKCWTLVSITGGVLDYESFTDGEKLKAALAKIDDEKGDKFQLFAGEPVPFKVSRTPTVQIGAKGDRKRAERKPRVRKQPEAKSKGTPVPGDFFEKPANGATPAVLPHIHDDAPTSAAEQE